MPLTNGIISAPVSVSDVRSALGETSTDVGTLCKSAKINKWAVYKPVNLAGLGLITEAQRMSVHYGLSITSANNPALLTALKDGTATQPLPSEITAAEWTYTRPSGGIGSPYRLTDFVNGEQIIGQGYNTRACAPDTWSEDTPLTDTWLTQKTSTTLASSAVHVPSDIYQWYIDGGTYAFCHLSIRFGKSSGEAVGSPSSYAMPLSYLMGNLLDGAWRLGLAVYLPYGTSANNSPRWMAFTSCYPLTLSNLSENGRVLPEFLTNAELLDAIIYNFSSKSVKTFSMVPILIKNVALRYNTATQKTSLIWTNAQIATMPSETTVITLSIIDDPDRGAVHNYSDTVYRGMYYSPIQSGTYKVEKSTIYGSTSNPTINRAIYKITIPGSYKIKIDTGASNSTGNLSATVTVSGNVTGSGNGNAPTVIGYASEDDYKNGHPDASLTENPADINTIFTYFAAYVGVSASNVTITLSVTKLT